MRQTLMDQFVQKAPRAAPMPPRNSQPHPQRQAHHSGSSRPSLKTIAEETIQAIEAGSFSHKGQTYDLRSPVETLKLRTLYYPPDSDLSQYQSTQPLNPYPSPVSVSFLETSTLKGTAFLDTSPSIQGKIGVLNFASAKNPGGGFLNGAQAQEESIARASSLYPSLMTSAAQQFYTLHRRDPKRGFYTHAMIYSPDVTIFRNDTGSWVTPCTIDVLTSPAVNAGVVRNQFPNGHELEALIAKIMKERMARILHLFEKQGVQHLVLGSFGTGVFRNDVPTVGRIWAELLSVPGARFSHSFESVVFAILGNKTFTDFQASFKGTVESASLTMP